MGFWRRLGMRLGLVAVPEGTCPRCLLDVAGWIPTRVDVFGHVLLIEIETCMNCTWQGRMRSLAPPEPMTVWRQVSDGYTACEIAFSNQQVARDA